MNVHPLLGSVVGGAAGVWIDIFSLWIGVLYFPLSPLPHIESNKLYTKMYFLVFFFKSVHWSIIFLIVLYKEHHLMLLQKLFILFLETNVHLKNWILEMYLFRFIQPKCQNLSQNAIWYLLIFFLLRYIKF